MARGEQLSRQWKLIRLLSTAVEGRPVQQLAQALECNPRTVYRDLEALQLAGFPIYADRVDGRGHWALLDAFHQELPLPLSLAELMALYFSREVLKVVKETVFHDALESLFQKIQATLPPDYVRQIERSADSLGVGISPHKPYGSYNEMIQILNQAIAERRRVEINYYAMSRRSETQRAVAPYKLWYFNGSFYLIGHCQLRKEIRVFALDRIKTLTPTEHTFEVPEGFNAEDFMGTSFGIFQGQTTRVRIRFAPSISGYIAERIWHTSQQLHHHEDGSLDFEAEVAGIEEIKIWILSWGRHARVLAPESLRQAVKQEAEQMVAQYC